MSVPNFPNDICERNSATGARTRLLRSYSLIMIWYTIGDRSQGWPESSIFNKYYTEM